MVSAKFVEDLINKKNWKILENSNISYSFSNVFFRVGGEEISRYVLRKVYPKNISKAHLDGTIHIHNLYMGITGYCAGWSLENILYRGLVGKGSRIVSIPPKHLRTAVHHLVNFVGIIQNEWSGAQAFNSLDTILAPYIAKDKLEYKEVKQCLQEFIYGLNVTNRWGGQSPFTNVTLDFSVPKDMENKETLLGNGVYGDFSNEMEIFNRAFLEIMLEGDPTGKPFTFPIPTYNITKDFPWESENSKLLFKVTGKYGLPYFSNFINSDLKPSDIRSMCCHLRLDLRQLKRNITGGLFGSGDQTGSIGVVTINMPRIGYLSKREEDFLERLEDIMEIAYLSLEIKRKKVKEGFEEGLFPYSNVYLGTLDNHFSTIGLVGMNEACENLLGKNILDKDSQKFALKVLDFMLKKLKEFQENSGNLYNLEATPAESVAYRLAKIDKKKYPKIKTRGEKVPFYTNSSLFPPEERINFWDAIKHQEELQTKYTGGTVFHIYLGESIPSFENCKNLVKTVLEKTKLPYITITPTYSVCLEHGYFSGKKECCPVCGKKTLIYSRIVGYFRPTEDWNPGKKEEFKVRKFFLNPLNAHT